MLATLTSSSYLDADTSEGVRYFYYVVSYNDNGESAKSKVVTATQDSISPTVVSTIPENNNLSGTTVTILFNEVIEIKCPEGQSGAGGLFADPPVKLVGTGGSGNTYYMGQIGFKGISISSQPFTDDANPNYSVTVSKDLIF